MTRSGISLIIAALLLEAPATRAAQLDKDACAKLKTEQGQLEQGGARATLGKGPEWGKANLAPEKLEQVRRLIELDEQLLFRCGGRSLVILPHDPDPPGRDVIEGTEGPAGPEGAKGAAPAPVKKSDPAKKQAVPVKKAAAPIDQPAKQVPPPKTGPQPEAGPAPAKNGEDKKSAAPPVDQPAKEAAKATQPVKMAPQSNTGPPPAKAGEDKKSAAPPVDPPVNPPVKEAAKEAPVAKAAPQAETGPSPTKEAEDKKAAAIKAAKAKAKKKADDAYSPLADWFSGFSSQAPPAAKK